MTVRVSFITSLPLHIPEAKARFFRREYDIVVDAQNSFRLDKVKGQKPIIQTVFLSFKDLPGNLEIKNYYIIQYMFSLSLC